MKIEINIPNNKIDFIKRLSMNNTPEDFIQNYINFNLLGIDNNDEINDEKDEFFDLKELLEKNELVQIDLASYFNVTQPTIARFMKNKSKRSELYGKIFHSELTLNELMLDIKSKLLNK